MSKEKIKIIFKKISSLKKKVNKISQNNENELVDLDGELLVGNDFTHLKFNKLQKRLNRKKVSKVK